LPKTVKKYSQMEDAICEDHEIDGMRQRTGLMAWCTNYKGLDAWKNEQTMLV